MPSEEPHPVGCPDCGSVLSTVVPKTLYDELVERNEALQRVVVARDRRIADLTASQWHEPEASPHYSTAMEVLEFWKRRCAPRTRELGGNRVQAVIDRLNGGYDKSDLFACVIGYASRPYLRFGQRRAQGLPAERKVDAETIFRNAKMVDQGIELAAQDRAEEFEAVKTGNRAFVMQAQLGLGL